MNMRDVAPRIRVLWPEPSHSSLSLRDRSPQLHESSQSRLIITKFELLPIVELARRECIPKSLISDDCGVASGGAIRGRHAVRQWRHRSGHVAIEEPNAPHGEHRFGTFLDAEIRNVGCLRFSQSLRRNEYSLFPASFFSSVLVVWCATLSLASLFFSGLLKFLKMAGTMNGAAKSRDHHGPTEQTPLLPQGGGSDESTPTASPLVHPDRGVKDIAEEEDALENGSQTDGEVHGGGHGILVKVLSVLMIGSSRQTQPSLSDCY